VNGDFVTPITPTTLLDASVLSLLIATAYGMLRSDRLFAVIMLSGIYSLLSASFFVLLDAVDVAFTEAAVGAGISTVLMLGGMLLTSRREKPLRSRRTGWSLLAVAATGATLFYASFDMPAFDDPGAPANTYVGEAYVERTPEEIAVPNIVTAVLASYRGYDTLGETTVIFTAGLAVTLLLGFGSMKGGRARSDVHPPASVAAQTTADMETGPHAEPAPEARGGEGEERSS